MPAIVLFRSFMNYSYVGQWHYRYCPFKPLRIHLTKKLHEAFSSNWLQLASWEQKQEVLKLFISAYIRIVLFAGYSHPKASCGTVWWTDGHRNKSKKTTYHKLNFAIFGCCIYWKYCPMLHSEDSFTFGYGNPCG